MYPLQNLVYSLTGVPTAEPEVPIAGPGVPTAEPGVPTAEPDVQTAEPDVPLQYRIACTLCGTDSCVKQV